MNTVTSKNYTVTFDVSEVGSLVFPFFMLLIEK